MRSEAFVVLVGLFALAVSHCHNGQVVISPPPVIEVPDGGDDAQRACDILNLAGCPVGKDPSCADAIRNDQAQPGASSQVDVKCILNAGPYVTKLLACRVKCL